MGLMTLARAHYFNKVRPQGNEQSTVRQIILPDQVTAVGLQLVADAAGLTYGAWGDIALPAAVTTDTLVVGIVLDTPTAAEIYTIDIGSTYIPQIGVNYANAAAVIAAVVAGTITNAQVHRYEVRAEVTAFAVVGPSIPIMLPFPIWYTAGQGILGRVYSVGAVANQIGASVLCVQGFK